MRLRLVLLLSLLLLVPATAPADSSRFKPVSVPATDLGDATGAGDMTAAGGHVVFSRAVGRQYELVDYTAATGFRVLPVGTRTQGFDADAGLGPGKRPVVTFSTCTGRGNAQRCKPSVLALDDPAAQPQRLRLTGERGLSLTRPSMHGDAVVAAAQPRSGSRNARILYWRTRSAAPRRLSGGTAECPSYAECEHDPPTHVGELDLGRRSIAYVWENENGGSGISSNTELRTAPLSGGHSRQANSAYGYVSGACGYRDPIAPNALPDGSAGFVLRQSPCSSDETTIALFKRGAKDFEGAQPKGSLVRDAAWDGKRIYWLSCAAQREPETGDEHISTNCRLVVSTAVPFGRANLKAHG